MSKMISLFSFRYLSICILLVLTALSYHPMFANLVLEDEVANPLTKYILLMTLVSYGFSLFDLSWFSKNSFMKSAFLWLLLIAVIGYFIQALGFTTSYLFEARNILMSFVFLLIGFNSRMDKRQLMGVVFIYSLAVSFSALSQIFSNFGGFIIADTYMQYGKNTLGVMTASSCIALLFVALYSDTKTIKVIGWGGGLLILFLTITIRARAAFLSVIFLSIFLIYKKMRNNRGLQQGFMIVLVLVFLIGITSLFSSVFSNIYEYMYSSFTQNQGTDYSSGRLSRNLFAIELILDYPFWGNLTANLKYEWIHNYALRQLSSYGLIGAFPIMVLYFKYVAMLVGFIKSSKTTLDDIGFFVVLIPFLISLEEPTFPYAPGTGVVLPFILLGSSLNKSYIVK